MSDEGKNKSMQVYNAAKATNPPTDGQMLAFVGFLYGYALTVGDMIDNVITCKNCDHCSNHGKTCYCFRYPKQEVVDPDHTCGEWRSACTSIEADGSEQDEAVHAVIRFVLSSEKEYWSFPAPEKIEMVREIVEGDASSTGPDEEAITATMKWLAQISAALVKDAAETKEVLHG